MPLVFVHGVNVRRDDDYDRNVAARDSMFRRFAAAAFVDDPSTLSILNPFWGGEAAKFRWNHASLPTGAEETFGGEDAASILLADVPEGALAHKSRILLETARQADLERAVDVLWTVSSTVGKPKSSDDLARLAVRALGYARANQHPDWLTDVSTDEEFVETLTGKLNDEDTGAADVEQFGLPEVRDRLYEGLTRFVQLPGNLSSRAIFAVSRTWLHKMIATFLGDVLVYINTRGTPANPGEIVTPVLEDLEQATAIRKKTGEPLIVVAHSMGGNIMYDILSWFRPKLEVDVLVTVGSQVSVLEELKLFGVRRDDVPDPNEPQKARMPKPDGLDKGINVFDANDALSFAMAGVFQNVVDHPWDTGSGLLLAHISYFNRPSFQDRLGARIAEALK
jgi:hypothetical protein